MTTARRSALRLPGDAEPRCVWIEVLEGCVIRYGPRAFHPGERLTVRESEAQRYVRGRSARRCR